MPSSLEPTRRTLYRDEPEDEEEPEGGVERPYDTELLPTIDETAMDTSDSCVVPPGSPVKSLSMPTGTSASQESPVKNAEEAREYAAGRSFVLSFTYIVFWSFDI